MKTFKHVSYGDDEFFFDDDITEIECVNYFNMCVMIDFNNNSFLLLGIKMRECCTLRNACCVFTNSRIQEGLISVGTL